MGFGRLRYIAFIWGLGFKFQGLEFQIWGLKGLATGVWLQAQEPPQHSSLEFGKKSSLQPRRDCSGQSSCSLRSGATVVRAQAIKKEAWQKRIPG